MTSAKQPSDETNRGAIAGDARIKQEILGAWMEDHPDGTPQQFEEAWAAMTGAAQPVEAPPRGPVRWDEGPDAIKRKLFEEWRAARPGGTMEQFDAAWRAATAGPDR